MSTSWRCVRQLLLLGMLALLPGISAGDTQSRQWGAGRVVRVATGPVLRPAPEDDPDADSLPTLAHGYALLVTRHSGLSFLDVPRSSMQDGVAAVCAQQADLVLIQGPADAFEPACADLVTSRGFPGGATVLAGRIGERLPHRISELDGWRLAAVDGGPYPIWLGTHHPAVHLLPMPSMHAALAAVDSGRADAAIGLESVARSLARRHFSHRLRVQRLDAHFPTELYLLARREDQPLLAGIEQALADIGVDEHARLLQRWARQALPAALADGWAGRDLPSRRGVLALVTALLALPLLAGALLTLRRRRDREQAQMTGLISHEMRNSAQAVMASIDLLGQLPLPARPRQLVSAAASASRALRSLLDRALDFSRLANGSFQPHPQTCDVGAVFAQALDAVRPQAAQKGLHLALSAPQAPLPPLSIDPDCLRQLLDNLLGNALKFTDIGGIELRVRLDLPPKPPSLLIEVIDSGIGIAPAQMARLFEPFQQADPGSARGGSGLGLSICRELARAMGGNLDAHSVYGRGSRFILHLPVALPGPDTRIAPVAVPASPLSGVQVLLVEDHDLNRQVVAAQLRHWGAVVQEAADASSALALQAQAPCPVVLLDIGLPGMDGYRLARDLRQQCSTGAPPLRLLALSARSGAAHAQRCRDAGIDAVLHKPLRCDALLQALGCVAAADADAETDREHAELAAAYDASIDEEFQHLQAALAGRDAGALRHHAHRLLGVLQMCGAGDALPWAEQLWQLGAADPPPWNDAQRLLQALHAWRDSRDAEAAPLP